MQKIIEISRYELERGKPPPSLLHSFVQTRLVAAFYVYEDKFSFFSELDLELNGWRTVPDVSVFPKMMMDYSEDELVVTELPLSVINILTLRQDFQALVDQTRKYFSYGVKSCWLVIPSLKNIYVFSSPADYQIFRDNETLHDPIIEVRLELSKVFNQVAKPNFLASDTTLHLLTQESKSHLQKRNSLKKYRTYRD